MQLFDFIFMCVYSSYSNVVQQPEQQEEDSSVARPRSESWLHRFGKSVGNAAKKVGAGVKKMGKDIGDGTKKVFAKKTPEQQGVASAAPETNQTEEASVPQEAIVGTKKAAFPSEGMRVATPYGDGVIVVLDGDRVVVHLDWCLADGQPARAYIGIELVKKPVPKIIKGAGKVLKGVGHAIVGDKGIFGKETWAKVGHGIKNTMDKATHGIQEAFKKRSPSGGQDIVEDSNSPDSQQTSVEEGENPYAVSADSTDTNAE